MLISQVSTCQNGAPRPHPDRAARRLVVNADDFGKSPGVNAGIREAHLNGIVTSASLMVRQPACREAADISRDCPQLGLGLHLDLGEWTYSNGTWVSVYTVVPFEDPLAAAHEIDDQIDQFRWLTGRDPTHLDSHQHVHRDEPIRSIALDRAARLSVPLRHFTPHVRYCGAFYGQTGTGDPLQGAVSASALINILSNLSAGTTEIACHPARFIDLDTMYRDERIAEMSALCNPAVRALIPSLEIELCSFRNVLQR